MANIRIKLGNVELDCEGPEEFLKAEIPNFWGLAVETFKQLPTHVVVSPLANGYTVNGHNGNDHAELRKPSIQSTTENLAVKLGVKSAPGLAEAAAARLTFAGGKDSFSREELHGEIKTATAFYNQSHTRNFTQTLRSLVKNGRLNEIAANVYALSSDAKAEIEGKIRG